MMQLELRYRSDIDLSQPCMQVEIRSHILRCLRHSPQSAEGVIILAGVEHWFSYTVQDDWSIPSLGRATMLRNAQRARANRRTPRHGSAEPAAKFYLCYD